ncbi:PF20097 family protein [Maledivibacter halophilus]|uniref:DUF6487 domain-containing protein n=1 Tax=Maledivibacter halophilus TaxID=36842 RepID=A0A1T5LUQ6_9FIRM|nr:PF20097 family protein [Maledivibacter halophilus]SKC79308.1 hypothetical protein SAMN02194393_03281 [Maledivibacter halophilus]
MKCPYCNKDMVIGTLESPRDSIRWFSPEEKVNKVVKLLGFGGEVISIESGIRCIILCYRCYECGKIIIEVPVKEEYQGIEK